MRDLIQISSRALRAANLRQDLRRRSCDELLRPFDVTSQCRARVEFVTRPGYGELVCYCRAHRQPDCVSIAQADLTSAL
jgi:hypothetical protein